MCSLKKNEMASPTFFYFESVENVDLIFPSLAQGQIEHCAAHSVALVTHFLSNFNPMKPTTYYYTFIKIVLNPLMKFTQSTVGI